MKIISLILILFGLQPAFAGTNMKTIYDFKVKDIDGKEVSLETYKDKVVLIVNVASKCGFTSQYEGLEKIYGKYKDQGFVVLGFPSNDFGGQEPGSAKEIKEFCQLTYSVDFPMFEKGPVKGKEAQELFKFLTNDAGNAFTGAVMWNFEKFLINRKGQLVERYRSVTKPDSDKVTQQIEKLLSEK